MKKMHYDELYTDTDVNTGEDMFYLDSRLEKPYTEVIVDYFKGLLSWEFDVLAGFRTGIARKYYDTGELMEVLLIKREFRIKDDDMLKENHYPVKAIFNMVNNERLLKVLTGISEGKGFGENYGSCVFPDDLDEYEIVTNGIFDGVEFGLHNGEEIVIDYKEMLYYLNKICNDYISDYPQSKFEIEKLLEKYKEKFINKNNN